ncbi:hypothetical protein N9772_00955 [Bacteroidia bacterium]|nr:hypothetical protein [Bacteroidia bacterium]
MKENALIFGLLTSVIVACQNSFYLPKPINNDASTLTLAWIINLMLFDSACSSCNDWDRLTLTRITDKNEESVVPIAVHI